MNLRYDDNGLSRCEGYDDIPKQKLCTWYVESPNKQNKQKCIFLVFEDICDFCSAMSCVKSGM